MEIVALITSIVLLLAGLVSLYVSYQDYKEKRPNARTSVDLSKITKLSWG